METIEHLKVLYAYNAWANRRLVAALVDSQCDRARSILGHLLIAEQEYFERLYGKDSTGFEFWPPLTIEDCGTLAGRNAQRFATLLGGLNEIGLESIASYRTSEGVAYENTWRELLTHVLFHSSIHRGNIMLKLRESGFVPPAIDHIIYLREK